MDYQIKDFSAKDIPDAVDLFLQNYKREKEQSMLLPEAIITDPQRIISSLNSNIQNGVAAFSNDRLIGYMLTRRPFSFKNQNAAMVPEYGHGTVNTDRHELYKLMYMKLSSQWKITYTELLTLYNDIVLPSKNQYMCELFSRPNYKGANQ